MPGRLPLETMTFFCTLGAAPKCKVRWGHHVVNGYVMPDVAGGLCHACHYFVTDLEQLASNWFGVIPEQREYNPENHGGYRATASERDSTLPDMVEKARRASTRAQALRARLKREHPDTAGFKVAASDGKNAISGFGPVLDRVGFASPEDVRKLARKIGYRLDPSPLDGAREGGWEGRYHACHAEKQLAVLTADTVFGTSLRLCPDCYAFFRQRARHERKTYVIAEPRCVKVFLPDGSVYDVEEDR